VTISGPTAPAGATVEAPDPAPRDRRSRRVRSARAREDRRTGYLLISPTVVIVFAMVVLPILWTFSLAFQDVRLLNLRRTGIIGEYSLDNFDAVLTSPGFVDALITTLVYSVAAPPAPSGWAWWRRWPCASRSGAAVWCAPACSCRTSRRWSRRRSCGARC
jgi:hypothetical protein